MLYYIEDDNGWLMTAQKKRKYLAIVFL